MNINEKDEEFSEKLLKLTSIESIEKLKEIGEEIEIKNMIEKVLEPLCIPETSQSYEELFKIVINILKPVMVLKDNDVVFKSKQAEFTFYLAKCEGEVRNQFLNIDDVLYEDEAKAKKWYKSISKIVHPDVNQLNIASLAFKNLQDIFTTMTLNLDDDENDLEN